MKRATFVLIAAVVIIAAVVLTLFVTRRPGTRDASVRIAVNVVLSGPTSGWGGNFPKGFLMGIDETCDSLHLDRKLFLVDMQDNAGKPSQAVSVFQKQNIAGFDVYVSGSSECSLAIGDQVDATGKPHFTLAFDPFFVEKNHNRLRVQPNAKVEGPLYAEYARARSAKKVYILYVNSSYANSEVQRIIVQGLDSISVQHTLEAFDFDQRDFKALAQKVKKDNPDLIFVIGYSVHLQPLIRDLRSAGLVHNGSVMAALDFIDLLYGNTPYEELDGVVFTCPRYEVTGAIPRAAEWKARYRARYGAAPSYVEAYGYDAAATIVTTYSKFHAVDTDKIFQALPIQGVTGIIRLAQDGDIIDALTVARVMPDRSVAEVR